LNLAASAVTHHKAFSGQEEQMKIALLTLLGLVLGVLGGAALGIGAGLIWVEIFKTSSFEGYSGMLVFFTFMPLGAAIGGVGGALLFGIIAIRDAETAIEGERPESLHLCNAKTAIVFWPKTPIVSIRTNLAIWHGVDADAPWAVAV
jgi:hypothetical protein